MHIALIADELTRTALAADAALTHITPRNYRFALRWRRPDFLLVESAWEGKRRAWKYGIAAYPDTPSRNNDTLRRVIAYARDLGIPTLFWNKEDSVHFDRFIASALLCDHILTVDENCLPRYRALGADSVHCMMFAVQPRLHYPAAAGPTQHRANFIGSYSHHIHPQRRTRQDMLFSACAASGLGLTVYDRNSRRKSSNYRYPATPDTQVRPAVAYAETAALYRDYLVSLNVNTIEDSPSMCSRRLLEIIASGGLAVTTPGLSVERYFAGFCHQVASLGEATELLSRLARDGRSPADREWIAAGAAYVAQHHSWAQRLQQIAALL